jgi:hypothetical protein
VEAMLGGPGMSAILKKGINSFVVEDQLRDALETKLQKMLLVDPSTFDQAGAFNKMTDLLKALPVSSTYD